MEDTYLIKKPPKPDTSIIVSPEEIAIMVETYSKEAFENHWENLDIQDLISKEIRKSVSSKMEDMALTARKVIVRGFLGLFALGSLSLNIYLVA